MNHRNLILIDVMLGVIIVMLAYLIIQNCAMRSEMIHTGNYLSEKIDVLTSYVKML